MYEPKSKKEASHHRSVAETVTQRHKADRPSAGIPDQRREAAVQRKLMELTRPEPLQKKENNTGLPDKLKSGVEQLSGTAMDDVKVHYNSAKPATVQAHAYAQGTDIHLAPGQERHLPHEAWHVVQQKQGRVRPTMQLRGKVNVNDDASLEREADLMGAKALRAPQGAATEPKRKPAPGSTTQRMAVVQREKDSGVRKETDEEMNGLSVAVIKMLERIQDMPVQESALKEKGAAKGEEMVDRSDEVMYALTHPVETVKQTAINEAKKAAKNAWKDLPFGEKLEICRKAAGLGLKTIGAILSTLTASSSSGEDSGSSAAAPKKKGGLFSFFSSIGGSGRKSSSPDNREFASAVDSLSGDDVRQLYNLMKKGNEARKEWKQANEEVNQMIKKAANGAGEFLGGLLGETKDSIVQTRLASEIRPQLGALREALTNIEKKAAANEDSSRYSDEYKEIDTILTSIGGPLKILTGPLTEEGLLDAKEQAKIGTSNLELYRLKRQPLKEVGKKILGFFSGGK